ncbi:MAG: hypothetical protein JWM06_1963 [Actinomycetia bacterium]|nr:hypothetical protein [Actinomycetes bacterium]
MRLLKVPPLLLAVPLLGVARLLPEHGFGLWLRLAAATLVLLAPGRLVARALGRTSAAGALAWSCALVAAALALTFAVRGSLDLTLALVLAAGAVALAFSVRSPWPHVRSSRGRGVVALAGVALGIALWSVEGIVHGDALFHLGRVRKLDDLGALSLRAVDEFKDGGLHPGYAFPLWHGWLALVAKLGGVDPTSVVLHESSILAPLALVLAFEMGRAVFRSGWLAAGTVLVQGSLIAFAPGGGGAYATLELPGTVARQLLVPAVIALFFRFVREPSWPVGVTLGAAGLDLAFVHPTYALFVAIPLVGFALARALIAGADARRSAIGLVAFGAPVLLAFVWLLPIVRETQSHNPGADERARALKQYATDLVAHSASSYHLAAGVVARTGAIAVAALVLVPLAALAARRRWSALVLGGTVVVLALELPAFVFPHFSDVVSLSQSRRAAGFVPFAFALVGGAAVLARVAGPLLLPAALAAGIVLQLEFPGDFGTKLAQGGPAIATWIAFWGGLAGLAAAAVLVRRGRGGLERPGAIAGLAVLLFVLPVAVHGFANWDARFTSDANALTPGLVTFLRTDVPKRAVVYADLETSYRISAYAPVYVANGPPAHVANTRANRPYERKDDLRRFLRTGTLAIPRSYHAGWLVLRRDERAQPGATLVYRDTRFRVYRL